MTIAFFLTIENKRDPAARLGVDDKTALAEIAQATPGLEKAEFYAPGDYTLQPGDDLPPQLVAILFFGTIEALETAVSATGHLQALATRRLAGLADAEITQQAMMLRSLALPDPGLRPTAGVPPYSYVVGYEGEAEDGNRWFTHYFGNHLPLVTRLPGLRVLDVFTRLDWFGALPWPRANYMLRSTVTFDSAAALRAGLAAPERTALREDFARFPAYGGATPHYPMALEVLPRR